MCSEQFFETLAGHGECPLSTSGWAPSTNAMTAAEKRPARPRFRHSTTGANCGLPPGLASRPSLSRTGLEGRVAHGPFGPAKIGQVDQLQLDWQLDCSESAQGAFDERFPPDKA